MPKPPFIHVPSSLINSFIDRKRMAEVLAPWIPDERDRAFVIRCILDEGPAHHRGTNYVLLRLLAKLVELGGAPAARSGPTADVPLRLPPHLLEENPSGKFPLRCPTRPIELLAPTTSPEFAAMVDCVTDGPPQHALANAATLAMLEVLLERAGALSC
jgi:hypothetical protein